MHSTKRVGKSERWSFRNRLISQVTELTTSVGLRMGIEKDGLMCLLFHAVYPSNNAVDSQNILPALALEISGYRQIFEYFLEAGYVFVSAKMILGGLPPKGKYVHVTFDDGYFNNIEILPLLGEYDIPAHIFVATSNVFQNKK